MCMLSLDGEVCLDVACVEADFSQMQSYISNSGLLNWKEYLNGKYVHKFHLVDQLMYHQQNLLMADFPNYNIRTKNAAFKGDQVL